MTEEIVLTSGLGMHFPGEVGGQDGGLEPSLERTVGVRVARLDQRKRAEMAGHALMNLLAGILFAAQVVSAPLNPLHQDMKATVEDQLLW